MLEMTDKFVSNDTATAKLILIYKHMYWTFFGN